MALPQTGLDRAGVLAELQAKRDRDADWRGGRTFSLVYNADDPELEAVLHQAADAFLHENALNPFKFPSLGRIEADLIGWTSDLLHGPGHGALTPGGTDSIYAAVKVARDHARTRRGIAEPLLLAPHTCHPAFDKAAHNLDVEQVRVPVGDDGRVDVDALAALFTDPAIGPRAGLVVASAPSYPYGVIDDVPAVAALAAEHGVLCHVDACLGGFLLPFFERIGRSVAPWDLRVPGVTSVSADIHKYGYTIKGASVVLFADKALKDLGWFLTDAWPGGMYGTPGSAGTRPAPPMAAAWAAMRHLGLEGYDAKARTLGGVVDRMLAGIDAIDGIAPTHRPDMTVLELSSPEGTDHLDVFAVGDVLDERGWHLDRQQGGLHLMLFPGHVHVVDDLLADLRDAVAEVRAGRAGEGKAAVYGAAPAS